MSIDHDPLPQSHPCTKGECPNIVPYDDEPYCFTHSPDGGSTVRGYSYKAMNTPHYQNLRFTSPADAARVVTEMITQAHRNSAVTLSYLNQLSGITGHVTDSRWGWTEAEMKKFDILVVGEEYELYLPTPTRIR